MHELPDISIKKIFVCEFITAGGFNHADLPASLVHDGELMRDALLRDLSDLSFQIITTVDKRLTKPKYCHTCIDIDAYGDAWKIWAHLISQVDAVWIIAPETDGLLQKLTQIAVMQGKLVLGCGLASIEIFSHKMTTYRALASADIPTVTTYTKENWPNIDGRWVVKPNDGAGCSETFFFEEAQSLTNWLKNKCDSSNFVIQPYQEGIAASISCVVHRANARVISCNRQLVSIKNNVFYYTGTQINGMASYWNAFESLAHKIAELDMDLNGYVGIDVIVKPDDSVVVVEINPRLTTSYVGLAQATHQNPAALILKTLTQLHYKWPALQRDIVNIYV